MKNTTKLFLDTEFTGLHKNTTLISLAINSNNDKTFYAEFNDYDYNQVNKWIENNVLNTLELTHQHEWFEIIGNTLTIKNNRQKIALKLIEWICQFEHVEIWSDCLAYDWVLFCDLFGGALDIPKNIFYIPFDISTVFKERGIDPDINRKQFVSDYFKNNGEDDVTLICRDHHAKYDAFIIKMCYEILTKTGVKAPLLPAGITQ